MNELNVIEQRNVLGKEFKIYGTIDEPLFLAKDVADWLDITNVSQMLNIVDESEKGIYSTYTLGGIQDLWFVTEDGLMEILFQSRKPIAKEFKKQVKGILKEIKRNGSYIAPRKVMTEIEIIAQQSQILTQVTQNMVKHEQKIIAIEQQQDEQQQEITDIRGIFCKDVTSFKNDFNNLANNISKKENIEIVEAKRKIYAFFEKRYGVKLKLRLANLQERLKNNGYSKTKITNTNKLDVIEQDKKLTQNFIVALKEIAINLNLNFEK